MAGGWRACQVLLASGQVSVERVPVTRGVPPQDEELIGEARRAVTHDRET